jgi:flagellar basal-body rod modification protein FlgD
MTISQTQNAIQPLFSGSTAAATAAETATNNTTLSSDFETFLKMLTVQMENQDPLNPIDSGDYAVQLATFSSVEQQVKTNDLLTALGNQMSGGGLNALGQWVGMEVRGGAQAHYSGDAVDLQVPVNSEADRRMLVIRDENGSALTRFDIPNAGTEYNWFGDLAAGGTAVPGNYTFTVEHYKTGQLINSEPATAYNKVQEARVENGITQLVLEGGLTVTPENVSGVRDPSARSTVDPL